MTTEDAELTTLERAQQIMAGLSVRRWRTIQVRYDANVTEIGQDPLLSMLVLAHEHWRVTAQEQGQPARDDWERFEGMSIPDLNAYLGVSGAAEKRASAAVPAV